MKTNCQNLRKNVVIVFVVMLVASIAGTRIEAFAAERDHDGGCPEQLRKRTPQQVLEDHLAAFLSSDAALVACDYARDAVFIQPGAVARGRDEIARTFAFFFGATGGNIDVSVKSLTFAANIALFEYALDSNRAVVPDGVDTFVIRNGLIAVHTAHLGGLAFK